MAARISIGLMIWAAALPASGLAQDAQPLRLEGLYLFNTTAQADGRPVCSELWDFGADGALNVESGQERVRKRYRTEIDRDGQWIVAETLETNGAPDCMGRRAGGVAPGESRTYVLPMNDGTIQTCPPPQRMADGAPFISACYGRIIPASQAG